MWKKLKDWLKRLFKDPGPPDDEELMWFFFLEEEFEEM